MSGRRYDQRKQSELGPPGQVAKERRVRRIQAGDVGRTARAKASKDPEIALANTVADVAVRAASALARAWPEMPHPLLRAITVHALYVELALAVGMRVPRNELIMAPWAGAGLDAFLGILRELPLADVTTEAFGAAHEALSGYTLADGRLEATNGRRANGVHFTPRSLTQPIVKRTLEPILMVVPPERTLELRVCDPSVGAGAFLLELVRQLGARAHAAGLAASLDEAKRLVAIHCAYGVDVCRFAVDAAQTALTLECRADRMPGDWLDGNIKQGDALVGLSEEPLVRFHWRTTDKKGQPIPKDAVITRLLERAFHEGRVARTARIEQFSSLARGAA